VKAITPQQEQITICQGKVWEQAETFKHPSAIIAENYECSTEIRRDLGQQEEQ